MWLRKSREASAQCIEQLNVFDRKWNIEIGRPVYTNVVLLEEDSEVYEEMQDHLLRNEMFVDCGTRNTHLVLTRL